MFFLETWHLKINVISATHVLGRPLSSMVYKGFGSALFLRGNENEYGESVKTYV